MDRHDDSPPLLAHTSLNPEATTTIVLIHGAFASGKDWSLIAPHLPDYHLIIPDLPSHGQSRHLTPFSTKYSAHLLQHLIHTKAIGGKAHVVGHSLGAHVAIALASSHPEVVSSVLVSGYQQFPLNKSWLAPYVPRGVWVEQRIENLIPRFVVRYLMDGIDIPQTESAVVNMSLCRQLVEALTSDEWPSPWPAPTLVIAATKGGIVPSGDSPQDAIRLAEIGRKMNPKTVAVKHEGMRHPWNRQAPSLFAATIRDWIDGRGVSSEFIRL